jgi:hypothetical protein
MKLIRHILRRLLLSAVYIFLLGAVFAKSIHFAEDLVGLLFFVLIAGGAVALLRRPASAPAGKHQQPAADAAPPAVEPASQEIPGARGARMAIERQGAGGAPRDAIAVRYGGQTKAYVTRDSWHPVGEFADLASDDPEYRLVALMSLYAQNVLLGYDGEYTEQDAIAYALGELVPHELLEHDMPDPARTASALLLPTDVLTPQNLEALRAVISERNDAEASHQDGS